MIKTRNFFERGSSTPYSPHSAIYSPSGCHESNLRLAMSRMPLRSVFFIKALCWFYGRKKVDLKRGSLRMELLSV
jgi:hypothetical protein